MADEASRSAARPERAVLVSRSCPERSLDEMLREATDSGTGWQGIAYTTAGARSVRGVSGDAVMTVVENERRPVPLKTIYELRLWAVDAGTLGGAQARELRWLNGSGAAEIAVHSRDSGTTGDECWFRHNAYLQHSDQQDAGKAPRMGSVEVFVQENDYGNIVFADELMTGRWA
ncbi:hypothetical protein [uncultured Propionibacterium sp.]|uniref:hypothetical protein n=1 Tax=uncultured Propionibacterium sp. TaxID=218066 RepID=UPI00292DA2D8|nr:hypothetical protein [uncultured Propionibacterium sp.]